MANTTRTRQSRQPDTGSNSAAMGVILVVAAVVIALLLFNAGGGNEVASDGDRTAAESATETGDEAATTTTSTIPVVTTPPANLEVLVGNGSGATGRAKTTAEKLLPLGYSNTKAVDGKDSPTTIVYFAAGFDPDALMLAAAMNLQPASVQPLPAETPLKVPVGTANLVVLIGTDFDPATATFGATTVPTN